MRKSVLVLVSCMSALSYAAGNGSDKVDIAASQQKATKIVDEAQRINIGSIQKKNADILGQVAPAQGTAIGKLDSRAIDLSHVQLPKNKLPVAVNNPHTTIKRGSFDVEKVIAQYNRAVDEQKAGRANPSGNEFRAGRAYLFISSSVPKVTLQNLLNDAGHYHVDVFLKGNIGANTLDFSGTQAFMDTLKINTPPELYIHPEAFKMFKIERVPALVIAASDVKDRLDEQGCAAPTDYDIIYGDLKLDYNINQIFSNTSSSNIKEVASDYMKYINASTQ